MSLCDDTIKYFVLKISYFRFYLYIYIYILFMLISMEAESPCTCWKIIMVVGNIFPLH